jgi:glycosyltransferase involved in cell wall biosynthesis
MTQPWLSVLIPTYNGEAYLSFALDSVLIQGENDIECIVVDDGSTDSTLSILNTYQNKIPIKLIQRTRQGNWVANTNYALSFATGKYVCFLHQDDLWFKNRLSTMKGLIEQFPTVDFFLHSSNFLDGDGNYLGLWSCPLPPSPKIIKPKLMTEKLLMQNFISIPAPIFKRELALRVGGLDEALWYTADWDLWLKISACSDTLYYPKPLSGFRIHLNSQTIARSSYLQDFRKQLESVVEKYFVGWDVPDSFKKEVYKIAVFSIDVNTTLASTIHKKKSHLFGLLIAFLLLGPMGCYRYFENSRIWERVTARLKARLITRFEK